MHTTNSLLDACRAKLCVSSDYALAQKWGVTKQRIYNYRRGETAFSEERAIEVADLLGLDRAEVLLSIQAERAGKLHQTAVENTLIDALRRISAVSAVVFLCFAFAAPAEEAAALARVSFDQATNYTTLAPRQALPLLVLAFAAFATLAPAPRGILPHRHTPRALFGENGGHEKDNN